MWMMQEGKIIGLDLKVISCQFWEMENKQNKKKNLMKIKFFEQWH